MKTQPYDHTRPGMLMHAPDDGAPTGVPAADSPTGSAIETAAPAAPQATPIGIQEPESRPAPKVISAKEALGLPESSSKVLKSMQKDLQKKVRDGVSLTVPVVSKQNEPAPTPEASPAPAAVAPEPVKPPEEPKIKVGDKEYTAKELETLIAKPTEVPAAPVPVPAAPPVAPKVELTPEQIEAQRKESADRDRAWVEDRAKAFKPEDYGIELSEKEFDKILEGGKKGMETFFGVLAKIGAASQLNAQKLLSEQLNPLLGPILERNQQIAAYEAESRFYGKFPDLQPHQETVRQVSEDIINQYERARNAVTKGIGTARDQNFVSVFEAMTPEDWENERAEWTRRAVLQRGGAITTVPPAGTPAPAAVVPPPAPVPVPQPRPPTGQLSIGSAPGQVNFQRAAAADMR